MKTLVDITSNTIASLNDIFDDFPNPLIVVHFFEEQRQVVYVNQAFSHEIGYSTAEIPNMEAWYQLAYPNEEVRATMVLDMLKNCYCHSGEETQSLEIKRKITCKNGIEKWYTIKIAPWREGFEIVHFSNIDELERKNQKLEKLNKLKDKLFSVISHDVRNPLVALRQLIHLLEEDGISEEDLRNFIPSINQQLYHVTNSLETTLNWVINQMQNNRLHPVYFDVSKLIADNLLLLLPEAKRKQINLTAMSSDSIPVFADKEMINLVIRNLIANAIKFTPQEGEIKVSCQANVKFAIVKIKDTGVGVSEVVRQKILDKEIFTTLGTNKEKGTGLGLLFCQEFISLNGGFFGIYSEAGKGSEFIFSIPLQTKL